MPELVKNEEDWKKYGILINTTQNAVKKNHICYKVSKKEDDFELSEVCEVWYPHPQAPEDALIPQIQFHSLGRFSKATSIYSALVLLYHANKNVEECLKRM